VFSSNRSNHPHAYIVMGWLVPGDENDASRPGGGVEKPEENMVNAGIVFIFTAWLQGQMADLTILSKNKHLIPSFIGKLRGSIN